MARNDYGCRYPGGHSIIDDGYSPDHDTVWSKEVVSKRKKRKETIESFAFPSSTKAVNVALLKAGTRIIHPIKGEGTVVGLERKHAIVRWDEAAADRAPQAFSYKNLRKECHEIIPQEVKELAEEEAQDEQNA